MNCKEALPLIHEYLDGDLLGSDAVMLKQHLLECRKCNAFFIQLETTEALVRSMPLIQSTGRLTHRILSSLPPAKKRNIWTQWVRRHPAVSVAAVFIVVMMSSFLTMWNEDTELMVKGSDLNEVVIQGNTVIVPKGHKVNGDLIVQKGKLQVEGEVTGNLVVIDGTYNLASTAHISGQITQIDQALSWVWYEMNQFFGRLSK